MPPPASIPRFLLPQGSPLWQRALLIKPIYFSPTIRLASKKAPPGKGKLAPPPSKAVAPKPGGPLVLEKPEKFNPPSHGSRKRKEGFRYPGPSLSEDEKARQAAKTYPRMMPPEQTFMGWFLRDRTIHLWISLSTLTFLAIFVWSTNFARSSPYSELIPTWRQVFAEPISSTRQFFEVLKMTQDHITAETQERRRQKVEDVAKRGQYRKAHGLDQDEGFGGWTAKTDEQMLGPGIPIGDMGSRPGAAVEGAAAAAASGEASAVQAQEGQRPKKPLKMWLGIW